MSANQATTSLEQLEAMLATGRISRADYETLKAAMAASPREKSVVPATRPRVTKSRTNRQLGGVCGGLADSLGLNANGLRWAFAVLAMVTGGTVVLVYLLLYLVLPWSEPAIEPPRTLNRQHVMFAVRCAGFIALQWAIYATFGKLRANLKEIYDQLGWELPAIVRFVLNAGHVLFSTPVGWVFQFLAFALVIGVKLMLPSDAQTQRRYTRIVYVFLVLGLLAALLGNFALYYGALFSLPRIVGRG